MGSIYCSVICLSTAAVSALLGVAFVGIAFSTDNWQHIGVDRVRLTKLAHETNASDIFEELKTDLRFFDRVRGIFRVCFPYEDKPDIGSSKLYLNPVEEWCTNVDYRIKLWDHGLLPERITKDAEIWYHLARSVVASFVLYFMLTGIACVTGLLGCWVASGDYLISTATLLLLASLFGLGGMAFWHGAEFYEIERVRDERLEFYLTWPEYLRDATTFTIGWSYIISWTGLGFTLLSSLLFSGSAICIRREVRLSESRTMMAKMRLNMGYAASLYPPPPLSTSSSSLPPIPPHLPMSSVNYYSAGFPAQSCEDFNSLYKNVVRELEDAKL